MDMDVTKLTEKWALAAGPENHIVVTSRVRLARNLAMAPFPPRAEKEGLRRVAEAVDTLIGKHPELRGFMRVDVGALSPLERAFLKEGYIISPEMELGGEHRVLYLDQLRHCVIMINEEDHLRMYCLRAGLQTDPSLEEISRIDGIFGRALNYAFSDKYGYLTTCPSNVGTGMRASVMLHLPGLAMTRQVEEALKAAPPSGLTVRGYYGENSEFLGDFYQISNEVTLGRTEGEIVTVLQGMIRQVIERETAARKHLFQRKQTYVEDVIWRAYGALTHARIMNSTEACKLLSPMRLGIERGYFSTLSHHELSQLIVAVQPAHIQLSAGSQTGAEERDVARAQFLRSKFSRLDANN